MIVFSQRILKSGRILVKQYLKRSEEITDELSLEIIDNLNEKIDSRRILSQGEEPAKEWRTAN
jgi:hypothetical protein